MPPRPLAATSEGLASQWGHRGRVEPTPLGPLLTVDAPAKAHEPFHVGDETWIINVRQLCLFEALAQASKADAEYPLQ